MKGVTNMFRKMKILLLIKVDEYYRRKVSKAIQHMRYSIEDEDEDKFEYWHQICERYLDKRDKVMSIILAPEA